MSLPLSWRAQKKDPKKRGCLHPVSTCKSLPPPSLSLSLFLSLSQTVQHNIANTNQQLAILRCIGIAGKVQLNSRWVGHCTHRRIRRKVRRVGALSFLDREHNATRRGSEIGPHNLYTTIWIYTLIHTRHLYLYRTLGCIPKLTVYLE